MTSTTMAAAASQVYIRSMAKGLGPKLMSASLQTIEEEAGVKIGKDTLIMPNTYLPCDDCRGLRYGPDLNDITWKGKNIGQVLQQFWKRAGANMEIEQVDQAAEFLVDLAELVRVTPERAASAAEY